MLEMKLSANYNFRPGTAVSYGLDMIPDVGDKCQTYEKC